MQHINTRVGCRMHEERVRRGIQNSLFFRQAKQFSDLIERRDDAGRITQLFFCKRPVVTVLAPFGKDLVVLVIIDAGVTENLTIDASVKRGLDLRSNRKLHVGDPHTNEFFILVRNDFLGTGFEDMAAETVGVERVGMESVNDLVEVVYGRPRSIYSLHSNPSLHWEQCCFRLSSIAKNPFFLGHRS